MKTETDAAPSPPDRGSEIASRTVLARWIVTSAVAVATLVVLGSAAVISTLHLRALTSAQQDMANLAYLLAQETDRSILAVEVAESGMIDRIAQLGITKASEFRQRLSDRDWHNLLNSMI